MIASSRRHLWRRSGCPPSIRRREAYAQKAYGDFRIDGDELVGTEAPTGSRASIRAEAASRSSGALRCMLRASEPSKFTLLTGLCRSRSEPEEGPRLRWVRQTTTWTKPRSSCSIGSGTGYGEVSGGEATRAADPGRGPQTNAETSWCWKKRSSEIRSVGDDTVVVDDDSQLTEARTDESCREAG